MKGIAKWLCLAGAMGFFIAALLTKNTAYASIGFLFLASHFALNHPKKPE